MQRTPKVVIGVLVVLWTSGCQPGQGQGSLSPPATTTLSPTTSPAPLRPAVPPTSLKVAGTLTAMTDPSAGENGCVYGYPFAAEVETATLAMLLPDGQAIGFAIYTAPTVGTYRADGPAGDGRPLVRGRRMTRSAGGGESGSWYAISGTVAVTEANNLGDHSSYGVMVGTLNVRLAWFDESHQITLRGKWGCVVDPISNGS